MLDGLGVALALLAVGGVHLLGSAAVLAVFAAAVALSLTLDDDVRATLTVCASVIAHSLTATPAIRAFRAREAR